MGKASFRFCVYVRYVSCQKYDRVEITVKVKTLPKLVIDDGLKIGRISVVILEFQAFPDLVR